MIQLPLTPAKHDAGVVFDRSGEAFCVSHGMVEDKRAKAAFIAKSGNLYTLLVEVCRLLVEAADEADEEENYQGLVDATELARAALKQVDAEEPRFASSLQDAQVGDLVLLWRYWMPRGHYTLVPVTRTSGTRIWIGEQDYYKQDGRKVGGFFTDGTLKIATPTILAGHTGKEIVP